MATKQMTYRELTSQIGQGLGALSPVYVLCGEEGFYNDRLIEAFVGLVPEGDRDFNLTILYAPRTDAGTIHEVCRRFPMMAERQVVIVKEAQSADARTLDGLSTYLKNPSPTTVLVISFRGEKMKGRSFMAAVRGSGAVVFESPKMRESDIRSVIDSLVKEKGLTIEPKGIAMLTEHVGTDLSRIHNEIDKLAVALGKGAMVTPEAIENHVGVSKDYNIFELTDALGRRDANRAFKIVRFFAESPKDHPWPVTLNAIYNFFSDLMVYQFARAKSPQAVGAEMGGKSPWAVKKTAEAARYYNAYQTIEIISEIRKTDCESKGVGSRQDANALLQDLVFHILNAPGRLPV